MNCSQLQSKVNQFDISEGFVQTISIGVVKSGGQESYEQLYHKADGALYFVKEKGRGGFRIANEKVPCRRNRLSKERRPAEWGNSAG